MNFRYKCILQSFFSKIPKGELLNYLFQKNISKSLPPTDDVFLENTNIALNHYKNFEKYNQLKESNKKYYEFGAGWTLTIPLTMTFLDFEVFCVDIRRLIFKELINNSLGKFKRKKDVLPLVFNKDILSVESNNIEEELEKKFGLNYIAPKDARNTEFESDSFDFISSTATLEHIPKDDILSILNECYRILSKGGIMSMTIDYPDHWSYFDKNVSIYNFLKYSEKGWQKYNPSLHYQNRLRHSDYLDIIAKTKFVLVKEVLLEPNQEQRKKLEALNISNEFSNYSFDNLAIRGSEIVLLKEE